MIQRTYKTAPVYTVMSCMLKEIMKLLRILLPLPQFFFSIFSCARCCFVGLLLFRFLFYGMFNWHIVISAVSLLRFFFSRPLCYFDSFFSSKQNLIIQSEYTGFILTIFFRGNEMELIFKKKI